MRLQYFRHQNSNDNLVCWVYSAILTLSEIWYCSLGKYFFRKVKQIKNSECRFVKYLFYHFCEFLIVFGRSDSNSEIMIV